MTDPIEESPKPWERQPYETQSAWAHFQLYLLQDPPRSINAAYTKYRAQKGLKTARKIRAPGSWREQAAGTRRGGEEIPGALTWDTRALAYDDYLAEQERQKWAERRLQLKEKEWGIGDSLFAKAEQMLLFPVAIQEAAEDGKTIIMPAGWGFRDIPAITREADKLTRLAADMSTEKIELDWRAEAAKAGITNIDELYRQLVREFEKRLGSGNDEEGLGGSESE